MTSAQIVSMRGRPARCALVLCLALPALPCRPAQAVAAWPAVALPTGASAFDAGEQMTVNGFPMRLRGFVTRTAPLDTAAWFRSTLGRPLVESRMMGKLILGGARGDFYVSVMLETLPGPAGGTRGTVTVSNLKAAFARRDDNRALADRMLARLPYGTRLLGQMRSTDQGRTAAYVQAENGNGELVNRDYLVRQLQAEGYALEREALVDRARARALPDTLALGRTLFFKGRNKEAMAVIRPGAKPGVTSIVLNTVNVMEQVE